MFPIRPPRFSRRTSPGPSEVIDHASYRWRARDWRGRPWHETVLIETHVGTFTPEGTYRAMIDKLDHLVATGITALELMPLADFAGKRNWGYDGVLWYAPDSAYGRPDDLKALIDEAHLRGLMVFLDVVYNHFGPEGNYLGRYAPSFFTEAQTPWGSAIDYRVPQVRAFAIENALYWLREYRFDGLRLDAVHAIAEPGEVSMLHDLSRAVGDLAAETGRHIHLVLENDDNRASLLDPRAEPAARQISRAMERRLSSCLACAADRRDAGLLRRLSARRRCRTSRARWAPALSIRAKPPRIAAGSRAANRAARLPRPPSSISCRTTTRSAIARSATGLKASPTQQAIEAALAITLLAPMIPMLFMGEEWGSTAPFPFFCDFQGDLADAVRKGRRKEFAWAYAKYGDEIPDPLRRGDLSVRACWTGTSATSRRRSNALALVRDLLAIRQREIVPRLAGAAFGDAHADGQRLAVSQLAHGRRRDACTCWPISRISAHRRVSHASRAAPRSGAATLATSMPPWSVFWRIGAR